MQVRGRVVLVTGASSGIGRAIAVAFGHEGAKVALTYNSNGAGAEEAAKSVTSAGGESFTVSLDLSAPLSIDEAVQQVLNRWGGVDVLIANAVEWPHRAGGSLVESDATAWGQSITTNLEGTARTVRAAWPALRESGRGRVVLISTGVTRQGMAGASAYATAKAGLEGLVAALKWEGDEADILINVVAPGFTVTAGNLARFGDDIRESVRKRTPSGNLSSPEDIAGAVVFLGSPANRNVTGAYLPVDGGSD